MKNDAERPAAPRPDAAHPMPQIHPIPPAGAPHRALVDREDQAVTLAQGNHHRPRLHARTLLHQYEFAAGEVGIRGRQQHGQLERKDDLAVQVLMQTVVIVDIIVEQ